MKDNKYKMEQELMEAFTYAKDTDIGMPDIDSELLLVRRKAAKSKRTSFFSMRIASIAACIVVVFTLGWIIDSYNGLADNSQADNRRNYCVAYVAGECITNEQQVMSMMTDGIMSMNDGNDIIDDQLNDFFNE